MALVLGELTLLATSLLSIGLAWLMMRGVDRAPLRRTGLLLTRHSFSTTVLALVSVSG